MHAPSCILTSEEPTYSVQIEYRMYMMCDHECTPMEMLTTANVDQAYSFHAYADGMQTALSPWACNASNMADRICKNQLNELSQQGESQQGESRA